MALSRKGLSQAEAARQCGIAQQSLNYIISSNLSSSKLAPQIASSLGINPEWLILGRGKFEENKLFELPIIHSVFMLKKFFNHELEKNSIDWTYINVNLGVNAFAYLLESNKLVICADLSYKNIYKKIEYLTIENFNVNVTNTKMETSYPIFEWRIRNNDF